MLLNALLFAAGIAALYFGAEGMVKGSSRLARTFGISPLVIGLTVVALGTSMPELLVSTVAAIRGQGGVAIGNVIGSNILNIALIVGVSALLAPLTVRMRLILREAPLMVAAGLTLPLLGWDGRLSRLDGLLLLTAFAGYLIYVVRSARRESDEVRREYEAGLAEEGLPPAATRVRDLAILGAGLAGLVLGAHLLVTSAVFFSRVIGISELVVGLTIVAIGTSLPELATSLVAAARQEGDIALGNAIGSNLFNSLIILGTAATVRPIGVERALFTFELPVMIGVSMLFPVLAFTRKRVGRLEGALLVGCYLAFTFVLTVRTI